MLYKVYWNSQLQFLLTLLCQAVCMGLRLVPLVGGFGVGLVGGWQGGVLLLQATVDWRAPLLS